MSDESLPIVDGSSIGPSSREATVAGVLLAAGTSSRFGDRNKLLASIDGDPIVVHAARTLRRSAVESVIVIVGHEADRVRTALADLDVTIIENDAYAEGQATSVRTGVEAIEEADPTVDAAVFALGDMPFVAPETVDTLIEAFRAAVGTALAAAFEGQRGNPVLFSAEHFPALADVDGDVGGRAILLEHGTLIDTGDPGVVADIDTPSDLDQFRDRHVE
ncbi:MAG: NTP transferase domain-containing protein [Halobacteriales archaeon]